VAAVSQISASDDSFFFVLKQFLTLNFSRLSDKIPSRDPVSYLIKLFSSSLKL
jgi:hypothetical protein